MDEFFEEVKLQKPQSLEELNKWFKIWIEESYNHSEHSALSNKTPADVFTTDSKPLRFATHEELHGRLEYACRNKMFAVITGDAGTGKSTAIRRLCSMLDANKYKIMYISDYALTPRNFYWEALNQLDCEHGFYRGDAKRQLQKELMTLIDIGKKIPVIITDEAHLLSREMLEEIRFLLNFKMDSYNPRSLILIGQSELKDILKLQVYEAIAQRINIRYHLSPLSMMKHLTIYKSI